MPPGTIHRLDTHRFWDDAPEGVRDFRLAQHLQRWGGFSPEEQALTRSDFRANAWALFERWAPRSTAERLDGLTEWNAFASAPEHYEFGHFRLDDGQSALDARGAVHLFHRAYREIWGPRADPPLLFGGLARVACGVPCPSDDMDAVVPLFHDPVDPERGQRVREHQLRRLNLLLTGRDELPERKHGLDQIGHPDVVVYAFDTNVVGTGRASSVGRIEVYDAMALEAVYPETTERIARSITHTVDGTTFRTYRPIHIKDSTLTAGRAKDVDKGPFLDLWEEFTAQCPDAVTGRARDHYFPAPPRSGEMGIGRALTSR